MSVVDEIPARLQAIQTLLKRRHADRIINNVDTAASTEPLHFTFEILPGINDDFIGARTSRQLALLFISNRRVHRCAELLRDLNQQEPYASRARVNKRGLTDFHGK